MCIHVYVSEFVFSMQLLITDYIIHIVYKNVLPIPFRFDGLNGNYCSTVYRLDNFAISPLHTAVSHSFTCPPSPQVLVADLLFDKIHGSWLAQGGLHTLDLDVSYMYM